VKYAAFRMKRGAFSTTVLRPAATGVPTYTNNFRTEYMDKPARDTRTKRTMQKALNKIVDACSRPCRARPLRVANNVDLQTSASVNEGP
jgi:hypothetical protein